MQGRSNPASKWPGRAAPERLRPFCTPTLDPRFQFLPDEIVFTIGSCFARNIEEYLQRYGMRTPTMDFRVEQDEYMGRPNGILNKYTPPAILNEIRFALDDAYPLATDDHFFFLDPDNVLDLHLNSDIPVAPDRARQRRGDVRRLFGGLRQAGIVVITLGLTEAWYDLEKRTFVNQAPPPAVLRRNAARFELRRLEYAECLETLRSAIALLNGCGTPKKIVLTVSPVPLGRTFTADDVIIANTDSKSILRAVAGSLGRTFDNVQYFPSYEMATISDPAVIWAAHDQLHLRDEAVGRIVRSFVDLFCPRLGASAADTAHGDARISLSSGDAEAAYAALKALAPAETRVLFLRDLVDASSKTARHEEAIEACRRLAAMEPDNGETWFLLCTVAIKGGAFPTALEAIERAISIATSVAKYHDYRSFLLDRLGRPLEAAAASETALRSLPDDLSNYEHYAKIYLASALNRMMVAGMTDRAAAFLEEFRSLADGHPPVLRAASKLFESRGDLEQAVAVAREEAMLANEFTACRRYGELCMRAHRHAEAAEAFRRASEARPDDAATLRQLAEALEACGRTEVVAELETRIRADASVVEHPG